MAEQGGGNRVREQEKGGKESYNTTDWDDLSDKMGRKQRVTKEDGLPAFRKE